MPLSVNFELIAQVHPASRDQVRAARGQRVVPQRGSHPANPASQGLDLGVLEDLATLTEAIVKIVDGMMMVADWRGTLPFSMRSGHPSECIRAKLEG